VTPAVEAVVKSFAVGLRDVGSKLDVAYYNPRSRGILMSLSSGPFPLTSVGDIVERENGVRYGIGSPPPIVPKSPDTVPFVRATDIKDGEIVTGNLLHVSAVQSGKMAKCLLREGELIVVRSGVNTGDCAVVPATLAGSYAAYDLILRVSGTVLPEFLAAVLYTEVGRVQLDSLKTRSAQPHLSANDLRSIVIPRPPLNVQRTMLADLRGERDSYRRKTKEADALLYGLDEYVMNQLGLTRPIPDSRAMFAVPRVGLDGSRLDAHFHKPRFARLLSELQRMAHKPLGCLIRPSQEQRVPDASTDAAFLYIEIGSVDRYTGKVTALPVPTSKAPSRARMLVRTDDIIVSLTRPHHGSIALITGDLDGCVASTGFAVLRDLTDPRVNRCYLWIALRTQVALQQMLQRSSGGNYPAVTEAELLKILVPIPEPEVQRAIAEEWTARSKEAARLRAQAEAEWQAAKARFEAAILGDKES